MEREKSKLVGDVMERLIEKHGGYRALKTYQLSRLIYDITCRFCDKYVGRKSRTHDQMVQAARSGVQNIVEGSQASATSKKMEIKLTSVARASLEELRSDYGDFLRQNNLISWDYASHKGRTLIEARLTTADDYALWVKAMSSLWQDPPQSVAANGLLVLLAVTCTLLDRQLAAQEKAFLDHGGFTERLYRLRKERRKLD